MTYVPDEKNGYCTASERYEEVPLGKNGTVHVKPVGFMWIHWLPGGELKTGPADSLAEAQSIAQLEALRVNAVYVPHFSNLCMGPRE
jgi:hypothetical protein